MDETPNPSETQPMSDISSPASATIQIQTKVNHLATPVAPLDEIEVALSVENLKLFYGEKQALHGVNINIPKGHVVAFIGSSGCGKSTLLRCFNRMNDLVDGCRIEGSISMEGRNIYDRKVNVAQLRRRVGMVFQKPNPFPKSIYENVAYGLRLHGVNNRAQLDEAVERSLKGAALRRWSVL